MCPEAGRDQARKVLAGYYAHCTALDDCVGELRRTLREAGLAENTLLVFTSDHGDMLGSQGAYKKQRPWDEAIRVPLLMHWPKGLGVKARQLDAPINSEDMMPTLLGLCGVPIPKTVEGLDYSRYARGGRNPGDGATVIMCASPFGEWLRRNGGKEYRGLRTTRYTYVRDLSGPWLLYDNQTDPYQTNNLVGLPKHGRLQAKLETTLTRKLKERHDTFCLGMPTSNNGGIGWTPTARCPTNAKQTSYGWKGRAAIRLFDESADRWIVLELESRRIRLSASCTRDGTRPGSVLPAMLGSCRGRNLLAGGWAAGAS